MNWFHTLTPPASHTHAFLAERIVSNSRGYKSILFPLKDSRISSSIFAYFLYCGEHKDFLIFHQPLMISLPMMSSYCIFIDARDAPHHELFSPSDNLSSFEFFRRYGNNVFDAWGHHHADAFVFGGPRRIDELGMRHRCDQRRYLLAVHRVWVRAFTLRATHGWHVEIPLRCFQEREGMYIFFFGCFRWCLFTTGALSGIKAKWIIAYISLFCLPNILVNI